MKDIIPFRIRKIRTTQFAIFQEKYDSVNGNTCAQVQFTFGFSEENGVQCISEFTYDQNETTIMKLELVCEFDISKQGKETIKETGKIDADFLRYIATIATGTARGVIHAKTEGTAINDIVLPPINLYETITEDFILSEDPNELAK